MPRSTGFCCSPEPRIWTRGWSLPPKKSCTTTPGTMLRALDSVRLAVVGISSAVISATPAGQGVEAFAQCGGRCGQALGRNACPGAPGVPCVSSTLIGASVMVAPGVADWANTWVAVVLSRNASVSGFRIRSAAWVRGKCVLLATPRSKISCIVLPPITTPRLTRLLFRSILKDVSVMHLFR